MDARTRDYFWARLGQCVATLSNDFVRSHTKLTTKGKLNKSEFHQLMEDVKNIIRGSIEFGHYFGESLRVAHVENEKLRRDYKESLRDAHVQNEKLRRENLALSDKLQQVSDPEIHRNTVAPASKINFHSFPASEASVERKVDSPPGVDPADLSELQEQVVKQRTDRSLAEIIGKDGEREEQLGTQSTPCGPLTQLLLKVQMNARHESNPTRSSSTVSSLQTRSGREGVAGSLQRKSGQADGQEVPNNLNFAGATSQLGKSVNTKGSHQQASAATEALARKGSTLQDVEDQAMRDNTVEGIPCPVTGNSGRPGCIHASGEEDNEFEKVVSFRGKRTARGRNPGRKRGTEKIVRETELVGVKKRLRPTEEIVRETESVGVKRRLRPTEEILRETELVGVKRRFSSIVFRSNQSQIDRFSKSK